MSKYFSYKEMVYSEVANAYSLSNMPESLEVYKNLDFLMVMILDPIREAVKMPIKVNSGYRCPRLNEIIGGVPNSQHLKGEAADITTDSNLDNQRILRYIQDSGLVFDQVIVYPHYSFIHISVKRCGQNRCEIIYKR